MLQQLEKAETLVETYQSNEQLAVGVVPYYQGHPLLVRRITAPYPGFYSLITGKRERQWISGDHPYYFLLLLQSAEFRIDPRERVEAKEWAVLRELHEELYSDRKTVTALRRSDENTFQLLMDSHQPEEVLNVVDLTTGYLVSIFRCQIHEPKLKHSEASDAKFLRDIKLEHINPLTQFTLWKLGHINSPIHQIAFSQVRRVKGLSRYEDRADAYTIKY